jgi:retinol dehydrogenase 12
MTANRANFRERHEQNIFAALSDKASLYQADRYNTSKLIEILMVRELGSAISQSAKTGKPFVILNTVNPGYCVSELQRNATPVLYFFIKLGGLFLARSTEVGSRTLFAGAVAGEESHGRYMNACKVAEPSAFVGSQEGLKTQKNVFRQLMELLESLEPRICKNV